MVLVSFQDVKLQEHGKVGQKNNFYNLSYNIFPARPSFPFLVATVPHNPKIIEIKLESVCTDIVSNKDTSSARYYYNIKNVSSKAFPRLFHVSGRQRTVGEFEAVRLLRVFPGSVQNLFCITIPSISPTVLNPSHWPHLSKPLRAGI